MPALPDLLRTLSVEDRRILRDRITSAPPEHAAALVAALREEALTRCAKDGFFWLPFVQTRDEADPLHSVKPFPVDKPYVAPIWRAILDHNRVAIAKSRQVLMSWIACAFCCWWARFHPNQLILWQTQKKEDAIEKVSTAGIKGATFAGRCQFIEQHLPTWMRQEVRFTEGRCDYPNGSRIQALAGGADQVRGMTASLYIGDEFAYQSEAKGVYTAVAPLVQKGAKLVVISTPNGFQGNTFAALYHGIPLGDMESANG